MRVEPERGNVVAAGVVALATLVYLLNDRFDDKWDVGIHLVYSGAAAAFALAAAASSSSGDERPRAWESILFLGSFVLAVAALVRLADVLGADDPPNAAGTIVWVGLLLAALMAWFASSRDSGISTLVAATTLGVVVVAFVEWAFDPEETDTFRAVLLVLAIAFAAAAARWQEDRPHHAVGLVNTAGLSILALAFTFAAGLLLGSFGFGGGSEQVGWGWELCILGAGAALIAYGTVFRQSGPGYLGTVNLLAFVVLAAGPDPDGPSLVGWPLVLIALTGALLAAGVQGARRS